MKFRKKPVLVEAFQINGRYLPEWFASRIGVDVFTAEPDDDFSYRIQTLEGDMKALKDDWIIKGVKGGVYPCKPDIFEATYEKDPDE